MTLVGSYHCTVVVSCLRFYCQNDRIKTVHIFPVPIQRFLTRMVSLEVALTTFANKNRQKPII